jgi:hypothetical protein
MDATMTKAQGIMPHRIDSPEACLALLQAVNSEHTYSFSKRQSAADADGKRETKKHKKSRSNWHG